MASTKQGKAAASIFAPHVWAVAARGDSTATFGSAAGCCAQAQVLIAKLRTEHAAQSVTALDAERHHELSGPEHRRRSITTRLADAAASLAAHFEWRRCAHHDALGDRPGRQAASILD